MIALLADLPWSALVFIPIVVLIAYTVFGATGFGSAIINVPTVAHWFPLTFAVPLLTLIDFIAALNASFRQWRRVDLRELGRLLPTLFAGIAVGATLLIKLPGGVALLALGIFVTAYGTYLLAGPKQISGISARWAWLSGFTGGIFSVLFGTGGPIFVIYLSARIEDKSVLRATSSFLIGIAVTVRTAVFVATGLLVNARVLVFAASLIPFMLAGYWLGNRLHFVLSRGGLLKIIAIVLLINGTFLIERSLTLLGGASVT